MEVGRNNILNKYPNALSWFFSIIFLISGASSIKTSFFSGLFTLALGFLLCPPFLEFVQKNYAYTLSKNTKAVLVIILLVLMSATSNTPSTSPQQTKTIPVVTESTVSITAKDPVIEVAKKYYKVTNVVDGDTLDVLIDGKTERIRLIGIDTPETVDPRKQVQCFGAEASKKAKELLVGQEVNLEVDASQGDLDKYNRLLRYVFLKDGSNFAEKMIAEGYGHEYTYNLPYKYTSAFKAAQKSASERKIGLWSPNTCAGDTSKAAVAIPVAPVVPAVVQKAAPIDTKAVPSTPVKNETYGGDFVCNCSKTCAAMSSCSEAQYQLNSCGCKARDADKDGVACDSQCQ